MQTPVSEAEKAVKHLEQAGYLFSHGTAEDSPELCIALEAIYNFLKKYGKEA